MERVARSAHSNNELTNFIDARMALIVLNLAHVNVQPSILRAPGEPLAMAGKPAERSMQMERALDAR